MYSWRLQSELKSDLERQARARSLSISAVLDSAVRDWLNKVSLDVDDEDEQRRLHEAAEVCLGTIAGANPRRAETARESIRERLHKRSAR